MRYSASKYSDFKDMLIRFDMIQERDGQTDRQTDGRTDTACRHIPRLCIAWHGKNHHFYVPWPFCLPWGRPCGNHAKRCMNEKTIVFSFMQRYKYHYLIDYVRVLAKPTQHVPIYLQQFPSYSNRKCKKSPFSCTAAHIFVFPGDALAIIMQCVAWIRAG